MVTYLTNAFSLSMLKNYKWGLVHIEEIDNETAKTLIEPGFISAIGHEATAKVLSTLLGIEVKVNRIEITLTPNDTLVVFQVLQRLPEGTILSEEQLKTLKYKFYMLKLVKHGT